MASKKTASRKSSKKASRKLKQPMAQSESKDTCFTIMPFGNWFDYYYEAIYIPAIEATGLKPRRADDLYRPSAIVQDIWVLTKEAKIILADLSGKNPNVFYELGLAHALTKPAILVTESMDDVPFDLRSLRVIVYDKNEPNWGDVLGQKIETAIKEILASPLDAVLPTFLKVKASATKKPVSKEDKAIISMRQDLDLIKQQIQTISSTAEPSKPKRYITFRQAIAVAESLLLNGVPDEQIITSLVERGVPSPRSARTVLITARDELEASKTKTSEEIAPEEKAGTK